MTHGSITTMKWWNKLTRNSMLNATESICSALGFKLDKSWEAYCQILSWTSIYLASLELDVVQQGDDLQSRILYALYYRPNGLKWNRISVINKKQQNALIES